MAKQTGNKANKLNIYNIASEAGVSIATVSRVLNDSPSVSAKTKEKVLSVIANCNYVPSAIAQNLSTRTSGNLIGIVCYNLKDIYYATAVSLLESALRKRGHHIILSCTGEDYMQKQKSIEMLITKQVDAVILIGSVFLDPSGRAVRCEPTVESAAESFTEMLDSAKKVDAVITANDVLAAGVLNAALARGLRISEDISIVGYNNSIIAQCTAPKLSSIDNRLEDLCTLAVDGLTKLFRGESIEGVTMLPPRIVSGGTM